MRVKSVVSSLVFVVLLGGCATTSFKSTWKDPQAQPIQIAGKKVVVLASNVTRAAGLSVEAAVADELSKLGANAMPSSQVFSQQTTKEDAKVKLAAEGFDAAIVVRMTDKEQEVYSTPGMYAPMGGYGSFYGAGWGYGGYYGSEVRTNTNIFVETLVYSVSKDKLVWSGLSVTTNPSNIDGFAREVTRSAINEMKKQGLILDQPAGK